MRLGTKGFLWFSLLASLAGMERCVPPSPKPLPDVLSETDGLCADVSGLAPDCLCPEIAPCEVVEVLGCPDASGDISSTCVGTGICEDLLRTVCVEGEWICDYSQVQGYEPGGEVSCDGKDNDCDGDTDENLRNACGDCGGDPVESCNGLDDDCDGDTDEGLDPAVSGCLTQGICSEFTPVCQGGTWVCGYEDLEDLELLGETRCDNRDNDCDGDLDEGLCLVCFPWNGRECLEGVPRRCAQDGNSWEDESCDQGMVCMGRGVCSREGEWLAITGDDDQSQGVVTLSGDTILVAATSGTGDGSGTAVVHRRFQMDGTPLAASELANVFTNGDQRSPTLSPLSGGRYLLAWESNGQDGSGLGIYGRAFEPDGQGSLEVRLTQESEGNQESPELVAVASDRTVLLWSSRLASFDAGLFGAELSPLGWSIPFDWRMSGEEDVRDREPQAVLFENAVLLLIWERESAFTSHLVLQAVDWSDVPWSVLDDVAISGHAGDKAVRPSTAATGSGAVVAWVEPVEARLCVQKVDSGLNLSWPLPICRQLNETEIAAIKLLSFDGSRVLAIWQDGSAIDGTLWAQVLDGDGNWEGEAVVLAEGSFPVGGGMGAVNLQDGRILVVWDEKQSDLSLDVMARFVEF